MGFETLLGNQRLKDNLTNSFSRGRASHFYLISGPEGSGKHTLASLLAAALQCTGNGKPCLACSACRKVMAGLHPDFITVEDPDHKNVPVDMIRRMRDDLFVRPNEGNRKIYMIPQSMRVEAQNALLKVLEEPPSYGAFLVLTDNAEALLPTVRSRCVQLQLLPLEESTLRAALQKAFPNADSNAISAAISRSGGYLGQAKALLQGETTVSAQTTDLVQAFSDRNSLLLVQTLTPMEKWKRDQFLPLVQQWIELFEGALACRSGMTALSGLSTQLASHRSAIELNAAIAALKKAKEYAEGNVSVAAICSWLAWNLR